MLKPLVGGMIILLCCAISSWTSYYLLTCELEFFSEALSRLFAVIRHPNALHSENVMAYDNAVSALGRICLFHRDSVNASQVNLLCCAILFFS